jgi:hypothetical protein
MRSRSHTPAGLTLGWALAAAGAGCDARPDRLEPPDYDPSAGRAAVTRYDANADGRISGDELAACPALNSARAQLDADRDGAITAEEVDARIRQWRASRVALMPVCCKVQLDGKPVPGARVTFEPEPCLGPAVRAATGTTDEDGLAILSIPAEHRADPNLTGVAPGFYSVIAEVNAGGTWQRLPAGSGCEVAPDASWSGDGYVRAAFESR